MNNRYIRFYVILVLTLLLVGSALKGFDLYQHAATNNPPQRQDTIYQRILTQALPSLLDAHYTPIFTIQSVERVSGNWAIVTIMSNGNSDTLRALIYDPTRSTSDMKLILAPSKLLTPYEQIGNPIEIPTPVVEKLNAKAE